ncbi:MAG: hypothetical protein J6A98_00795 [Clostridia bacterium]|nr:hypothetical protein [Clostridia bacterium]
MNEDRFTDGFLVGSNSNGNNGGWGNGSDFLWVIVLLALFGRGGFGGGFGGGGGNCCNPCATQADLAAGFNNSAVLSNLNDLKLTQASNLNFVNQGFAGLNTVINQGFAGVDNAICTLGYQTQGAINGISREIADCCCKTQRGIDSVNYNMATNTCAITNAINSNTRDIIEAQNANYSALHEEIVANKIEAKNERIAEQQAQITALQLKASQEAQNAYLLSQLKPSFTSVCSAKP